MRRVVISLNLLVLILIFGSSAVAWYFSEKIGAVNHKTSYNVLVKQIDGSSVTLARTHDNVLRGTYAISWPSGRAIVDDIISMDANTVTRHLAGGPVTLAVGTKIHWDVNVFAGDPSTARNLSFENVNVDGALGNMPAWYVPATKSTWVIIVHGHDSTRETSLRVLPAIHNAGYPALSVTFRNDAGAPASPDKTDHLGASEWHDVDSAITYARNHGAKDVVLYGGSMGGALVAQTVKHSSQAELVRAVIFDSPVLDWRATLDAQGAKFHLPVVQFHYAEQVFSRRYNVDFDDLDQVRHAHEFKTPILLFYGTEDMYVPTAPDLAFARALPDLVKLVPNQGATHTAGWNVDPVAYEAELVGFLNKVAS